MRKKDRAMGMVENFKSGIDRNKIKWRNFAESEAKHLIRISDKNAENAIFRKRDDDTRILE